MLIERAMISDFLKESGVDAAFIEKDENCRYISGFTGSDSYLFLTANDCYLLTDSRYTEQAKEEAKGFTIIDYAGKLAKTVGELSAKHHVTRFGIEAGMTYKMYLSFDEVLPETDFVFVVLIRCARSKARKRSASSKKHAGFPIWALRRPYLISRRA